MFGRLIKEMKGYAIYATGSSYIVRNLSLDFSEAHTHVRNLKAAEMIIHKAHAKEVPHDLRPYLLWSIYRVTDCENHKAKIKHIIDIKKSKGKPHYFNTKKR